MLWLKGWLETRSRVAFALTWAAGFLLLFGAGVARREGAPPDVNTGLQALSAMALVWVFVPVWLAGAGVRTQSAFGAGATRGLHGSTHFTLSLPVSRARLLLVRATLGLLETAVVIGLLAAVAWFMFPALRESARALDALQYLLTVYTCVFGIYGLAVLVASVLEDVWVIPVSTVAIVIVWTFQFVGALPSSFNPFHPMTAGSPFVTHTLPLTAMVVSLAAGAACLLATLKVVERQDY